MHHLHSRRRGLPLAMATSLFAVAMMAAVAAAHIDIDELVSSMTQEDLISQLSQIDISQLLLPGTYELNETLVIELLDARRIGSVLNSPSSGTSYVPSVSEWRALQQRLFELSTAHGTKLPLLFGLDSVHGANYVFNATLFPQQLGMAAAFNRSATEAAGRITALETRYAGVPWVFSPILDIAVQPSWARVFETFGEDPFLATQMGIAIITGLQSAPPLGSGLPPSLKHLTAACMKHFIGYPNVRTGHDRTPVFLPMNILLQYFAPSFQGAISAGVLSAMENYIELNGQPVVASHLILTTLLRKIMHFEGMLVTDYNEIFNLFDFHRAVSSYSSAVATSMNQTTIDMAMIGALPENSEYPFFTDELNAAASKGEVSRERLEASAKRVLQLKQALGLLEGISPVPIASSSCMFGCREHHNAAMDAARQSLVLLQNEANLLPLPSPTSGLVQSIGVIGAACNSSGLMSGGWTVHWQGTSNVSALPYGGTVVEELQRLYPAATVAFEPGCNITADFACDAAALERAATLARYSSFVVVCAGERHYAEKPGDIDDLTLPGDQIDLVGQIVEANPRTVVVLVEGRPRVLGKVPELVPAIVFAPLPGPYGGQAVAELIAGMFNPSGRLPITYPKTVNNAPLQYWRKYSANNPGDYVVQWPFGHGLSYSNVAYGPMSVAFSGDDASFHITFTVRHVGGPAVDEVVLLYSTQLYRAITPEVQQLRGFDKVRIMPGASQEVHLAVFWQDLAFYDEYNCQTLSGGTITFSVANQSATAEVPLAYQWPCETWGEVVTAHTGGGPQFKPGSAAPAPPSPPQATPDYFISSIVCFGAGIIGTVFIVVWLRKKGQGEEAGRILEPNGI